MTAAAPNHSSRAGEGGGGDGGLKQQPMSGAIYTAAHARPAAHSDNAGARPPRGGGLLAIDPEAAPNPAAAQANRGAAGTPAANIHALQCAVEIANNLLGEDQVADAEDRLAEEANVRRMVSIKVIWGSEVRMLTVPRRLTWTSLLLEIGRRFKAQVQGLSWVNNYNTENMLPGAAGVVRDCSGGDK